MAYALDVQPACRDVGRDQKVDIAVLKCFELLLPCCLINIAMDFARTQSVPLQTGIQLADGSFAVAEDNRIRCFFTADQIAQHFALLHRCHIDKKLLDIGVCRGRARYLDIFRVRQKLVRQLLDRRRHGRGEQQRLSRRGQFGANMFNVGNKAHVQHAVRFVDHQHFATGQQYFPAFEQVHQATGRRNQNVDTLFQRLDLITHLHAADEQRHGKLVIFTVFFKVFGNLRSEFTRRFQNQAPRHTGAGAAVGEHIDHG